MSCTAIKVENLGKRYRIGQYVGYKTLRETLLIAYHTPTRVMGGAVRRWREGNRDSMGPQELGSGDYIWALKDVSFEVKQGEAVGIIGRNGSGKSTLLKIISRITAPTEGYAEIHGRVGSLLEVGTGFHPELTGRENIYLNGAVLGMKRAEVDRKFDEVVAFAEIEKFLDTPVKRYSSGMYMRLAFAVAAHLEPEILIVDEVLAVGDATFQRKCLGKMADVTKGGRTVLFVSHNMAAVTNLCNSCLLLDQGRIRSAGIPKDVIDYYLSGSQQGGIQHITGEYDLTDRRNTYPPGRLVVKKVRLLNSEGNPQDTFLMGHEMIIAVEVEGMPDSRDTLVGAIFKSSQDQWLASTNTGMTCSRVDQPRQPREVAILRVPQIPFTPGSYWIDISVTHGSMYRIDYVDRAARFSVIEADVYGTGYRVSADYGVIYLNATWEIRGADSDYILNQACQSSTNAGPRQTENGCQP